MKMLQCRFIWASLLVLNVGCFLEGSCRTVYTYTTKDAEALPCTITEQTPTVIWAEIAVVDSITVLTYQSGNPPLISMSTEEKYNNFNYTLEPTSFNLVILNVEDEDGGVYGCSPFGSNPTTYDVTVEVLAKPTVRYESQDVDVLDVIVGTSYDLTCSATKARSMSDLSFMWDPSLVVKTPLSITSNGDYKDYSITFTYTAVKGGSSITCQLTGYVMQDEINDQRMELISHTMNLNVRYAPVCSMTIQEEEDCRMVTLTCECNAVPAVITQYSFFKESDTIHVGTSNTFTVSVVYETSSSFSCSATNAIGHGDKSDGTAHYCDAGGLEPWAIALVVVVVVFALCVVIGYCLNNHNRKKKKRELGEGDIDIEDAWGTKKPPTGSTKKKPTHVDFSINTKQSELIKETGWSDEKNADSSSVEEAKETMNDDDDEKKSDHRSSSSVTVKADIESSSAS